MITPRHVLDPSRANLDHVQLAEQVIDRLLDEATQFPIHVAHAHLLRQKVPSLRICDCLVLSERYRAAGWLIRPESVSLLGNVFCIDGIAPMILEDSDPTDADPGADADRPTSDDDIH